LVSPDTEGVHQSPTDGLTSAHTDPSQVHRIIDMKTDRTAEKDKSTVKPLLEQAPLSDKPFSPINLMETECVDLLSQ